MDSNKLGAALTVGGIVFFFIVIIGFAGFVGVDPGVEKTVVNKGELQGSYDEGWYWFNPLTTDTHKVSVRPQIYVQSENTGEGDRAKQDDSIESKTVDGNIVYVDVAIRYNVTDSEAFYLQWYHPKHWPFGKFENEQIRSPSRDLVRDIVGNITSSEVYTGTAQQHVEDELAEHMRNELKGSGASLIGVDVRNIRFSESYQAQLEAKAKAQQEYEIKKEQAEADANAKIIRANADANATIIRAKANRKADKIRQEGLTDAVLTIRQIEALENGTAIYVPVGENGLPMFLNATHGNSSE